MSDYNARLAKLTKYQEQQIKQADDTRLTDYQDQQLKQADSAARLTDYQDQQLNGMSTGLEERKKGGRVKKTGIAMVHKNEFVLTATQAKALKKMLNK
jgi:hypothetical protein